jgi:hypothetical protein
LCLSPAGRGLAVNGDRLRADSMTFLESSLAMLKPGLAAEGRRTWLSEEALP